MGQRRLRAQPSPLRARRGWPAGSGALTGPGPIVRFAILVSADGDRDTGGVV